MAEEIKIPSKLDTDGIKQERIEIKVCEKLTNPSNFSKNIMPQKGDHIRVKRLGGIYFHHGIYESDEKVYHLTGKFAPWHWKNAKPECTTLTDFLDGGNLEVRVYNEFQNNKKCNIEIIIDNAKRLVKNGKKGYNLLWNNCECFANSCVFFDNLDEIVKKINLTKQAQNAKNGGLALTVVSVILIGGKIALKYWEKQQKQRI